MQIRLLAATMLFAALPAIAQKPMSYSEAHARATKLVSRMTLDEKISQVHGIRDADHHRYVPGVSRLGIPGFRVTNGPAGVGPNDTPSQQRATALPAPIALAATWDPELARQYGAIAGQESRALDNTLLESPDVNIARIPQGGRVFESFGEDPYLASRLAVAEIEGIQSTGTIANVKHFVANNQETNRFTINEIIAERALREIYMPAFEASVKEAHVASVMCAYPRINGGYNCENNTLMTDVLRRDWKFDGFVTSDFGAVHSTAPSVLAGLDLEMPTGKYLDAELKKAIETKQIAESALDDMLVRRFTKMMEMGWFATHPQSATIPVLEHGAAARAIAEQGMVLLKNDGAILPLDQAKLRSIALIGPYAVRAATGGGGSSHVIPVYSVQPADGIDATRHYQTRLRVLDGHDLDAAVQAAKAAEIVVLMVGEDESEGRDHSIELPQEQNRLIDAVATANPKTVVVLKSGSAVLMPWLSKVPAVLEAWYPGAEDGNAVADVLFGITNPSGKLPLSVPEKIADTLAANADQFPGNGEVVHYSEGLNVGYRAFQANGVKPLFPFGFGLSYTSFEFSDLAVEPKPTGAIVRFRVKNTGLRAGAEVAQLYLTFPKIAEGDEPPHQLKGFKKVMLAPGESRQIELALDERAVSYFSESLHAWRLAKGNFQVALGSSSANTALTGQFSIQ